MQYSEKYSIIRNKNECGWKQSIMLKCRPKKSMKFTGSPMLTDSIVSLLTGNRHEREIDYRISLKNGRLWIEIDDISLIKAIPLRTQKEFNQAWFDAVKHGCLLREKNNEGITAYALTDFTIEDYGLFLELDKLKIA